MPAKIVRDSSEEIVLEVTIPKHSCFMECESAIREHLNHAGRLATASCLEDFDTDGSPIIMGGLKFTAKTEKVPKNYESPFGRCEVARFCYQSSSGGACHVPLDRNARIIGNSTPLFANLVSFKYSHNKASTVERDLEISMGRKVSRCYIQDVSRLVGDGIRAKDNTWDLTEAEPAQHEVATVAIGIDGACLLYCEEGYRQAMAGTIAHYDAAGERLHTIYVGHPRIR